MNINRISVFAVCFAVGLAIVSEPSMAKWKKKKSSSSKYTSAQQLPAAGSSMRSSNSTGYPNGRPFQAIKVDFEELHDRFDTIDTELGQIADNLIRIGQAVVRVERNTEAIDQNLIRVGQAVVRTEANTNTIINAIGDLDTGIGDLDGKVDDIAADVTLMKNTLEVQVSAKSATDTGVTLYVQVIRNGIGLEDLPQAVFTYGNSFPLGAEAKICEVNCFEEGVGGLYAIKLVVGEDDQTFAGTLMVADRDGAGTSLVTFDIPAAPVVPAP
jgi:hypothetical protein